MRKRIVLIDFLDDGHHATYALTLITGLQNVGHEVLLLGTSRLIQSVSANRAVSNAMMRCLRTRSFNGPAKEWNKILSMRDALVEIRSFEPDVVHFLQLDRFMVGVFLALHLLNNVQVVSTLHWYNLIYDRNLSIKLWINSHLFKYILKKSAVVTHSLKINEKIDPVRANSLYYAPYPIHTKSYDKRAIITERGCVRAHLGLKDSDLLLLCFGATRYDKGVDIVLRALSYLNNSYKLLIAGKEDYFTEEVLKSQAAVLGIESRIIYRMSFIKEEDVLGYFCSSDYVLVPYRKNFEGQSGPLTYAASLGIPVVGCSATIIKETIDRYQLGATFEAESPALLAKAVTNCKPGLRDNTTFKQDHHADNFCKHVAMSYGVESLS